MAEIVVTDRDGREHRVPGKRGHSLMETLRELDYGVAAICGGLCSCATCHVYVAEPWRARLPAMQDDERERLSQLDGYQPEASRLSCQFRFDEKLDGLRVEIAPDE